MKKWSYTSSRYGSYSRYPVGGDYWLKMMMMIALTGHRKKVTVIYTVDGIVDNGNGHTLWKNPFFILPFRATLYRAVAILSRVFFILYADDTRIRFPKSFLEVFIIIYKVWRLWNIVGYFVWIKTDCIMCIFRFIYKDVWIEMVKQNRTT